MNRHVPPDRRQMQVYPRMRAPIEAKPFALQGYVIQAIRHSPEISSGDSAYQNALKDLLKASVTELIGDFGNWANGLVSGELQGRELEIAIQILDKGYGTVNLDEEYPDIAKFNREFLNGNGQLALIYSLIIDAADVDLVAMDKYRGGASLEAVYGPRRTQAAKREGKRIRGLLKRLASFDEPAMMAAADEYVVYRHVCQGQLPIYKRREELAGRSLSSRRRKWFRDFDNALGYSSPKAWSSS